MKSKQLQKLLTRLFVLVFVGILALTGFISLVAKKPTVSETEKRTLATCPAFSLKAIFSGEWTKDFEAFYADTFPGREGFVSLGAWFNDLHGFRLGGVKFVDVTPIEGDEPGAESDAETSAPVETGTTPAESAPAESDGTSSVEETSSSTEETVATTQPPEDKFFEKSGGIVVYDDRAMEVFAASGSQCESYADAVSKFAKNFPNVKVYSMVVPTSIEFYLPDKYKEGVCTSEKDNIEKIYSLMDSSVTTVDAYSKIAQHTSEYLYFRTDHHWTGKGAYYAYTAFCEAAGFTPADYDSYELRSIDGFLGTLAASSQDGRVKNNPDTVEYCKIDESYNISAVLYNKATPTKAEPTSVYHEYASGGNAYGVYLSGDVPRFDITNNDITNGKNIVIFKESYGNCFSPYLMAHYSHVYILDLRYFTGSVKSFIAEHDIDEILVIDNEFAANTGSFAEQLSALAGS